MTAQGENRFDLPVNGAAAASAPGQSESAGALFELFERVQQYKQSPQFGELIRFIAQFRAYSPYNAMLVKLQMPGARFVLSAKRWDVEHRRTVKSNARPLVMLKPMGPVMFGFDVSDTEGLELPEAVTNPFAVKGILAKEEFDRTVQNARRDGVDIQQLALGSTLGGYVRNASDPRHVLGFGFVMEERPIMQCEGQRISRVAEITLNANLPIETNYATLTHELGHLYCGHVGTPDPKAWPDRRGLTISQREFEAESVSYLVCQRAGLDSPAVSYMNGYLESHDQIPTIDFDIVLKVAQRVEQMRLKSLPICDHKVGSK